jgi:hypothetical protein
VGSGSVSGTLGPFDHRLELGEILKRREILVLSQHALLPPEAFSEPLLQGGERSSGVSEAALEARDPKEAVVPSLRKALSRLECEGKRLAVSAPAIEGKRPIAERRPLLILEFW